MKRKNLLIFGASIFTSAIAIGLGLLARQPSIFEDNNRSDQGTFVLSGSSITRSSTDPDQHQAIMLDSGKNSVNVTIKRASVSDNLINVEQGDYITISNDLDSPIRGITSFSIRSSAFVSGDISNTVQAYFYLSYNQITLENVFAGKYHDLVFVRPNSMSSDAQGNLSFGFGGGDSRYFLAVICGKQNFSISEMTIHTPCAAEPTREDESVGTYSSYKTEEAALLPESFPFVGNGSYQSNIYGGMIQFHNLQQNTFVSSFYSSLTTNGYQMANVVEGTFVFQKETSEDSGQYYTILLQDPTTAETYGDLVYIMTAYYGVQDWMGSDGSFPLDDLKAKFSSETFVAHLSSPSLTGDSLSYMLVDASQNYVTQWAVIISGFSTEPETLANYGNEFEAYLNTYVTQYSYIIAQSKTYPSYDENYPNSYSYSGKAFSPDYSHCINLMFSYNEEQSSITGQMLYLEYARYNDSTLGALIDSLFGAGAIPSITTSSAYYVVDYATESGSSKYFECYAINITDTEAFNYRTVLLNNGFTTNSLGETQFSVTKGNLYVSMSKSNNIWELHIHVMNN